VAARPPERGAVEEHVSETPPQRATGRPPLARRRGRGTREFQKLTLVAQGEHHVPDHVRRPLSGGGRRVAVDSDRLLHGHDRVQLGEPHPHVPVVDAGQGAPEQPHAQQGGAPDDDRRRQCEVVPLQQAPEGVTAREAPRRRLPARRAPLLVSEQKGAAAEARLRASFERLDLKVERAGQALVVVVEE
jgi:hypothetical protein